jgi:hypothetical protein
MLEAACCLTVLQAAAIAARPSPNPLNSKSGLQHRTIFIGQTARSIIFLDRLTLLNQSNIRPSLLNTMFNLREELM